MEFQMVKSLILGRLWGGFGEALGMLSGEASGSFGLAELAELARLPRLAGLAGLPRLAVLAG